MDPVEQTLAQGRTQNSPENFADYYAKGRQLSLSEQHLALQQQQQQNENAKQPLIMAHMALTNENEATKNKVDLLTLNNLTDQNAAVPRFLDIENRFMQSPDGFQDKALWKEAIDLGRQYPGAAVPGGPLANLINFGKADFMAQMQVKQLLSAQDKLAAEPGGANRFISHVGPTGISVNERQPRAPIESFQKVEQLLQANEAADNAKGITWTPEMRLQKRADITNDVMLPIGSSTTITAPDGTTIQQNLGRQPPPKAESAGMQKLDEKASGLTDLARNIEDLIPHVGEIYGPQATLGNMIVDKGLANINPDWVSGTRVEGRSVSQGIYQGMLRKMAGSNRVNVQEMKRLQELFPALSGFEGLHESPANAAVLMRTLQQQLTREAYMAQVQGNKPHPAETLRFLDPAFLQQERLAGRITQEQLIQAIKETPHKAKVKAMLANPQP